MKVFIEPVMTRWKGGAAVHDRRLDLAGHGRTEAEAVSALLTAVEAWCRALGRQGVLEDALDRAGIRREDDGGGLAVIWSDHPDYDPRWTPEGDTR
jgi:hypothetical protein